MRGSDGKLLSFTSTNIVISFYVCSIFRMWCEKEVIHFYNEVTYQKNIFIKFLLSVIYSWSTFTRKKNSLEKFRLKIDAICSSKKSLECVNSLDTACFGFGIYFTTLIHNLRAFSIRPKYNVFLIAKFHSSLLDRCSVSLWQFHSPNTALCLEIQPSTSYMDGFLVCDI